MMGDMMTEVEVNGGCPRTNVTTRISVRAVPVKVVGVNLSIAPVNWSAVLRTVVIDDHWAPVGAYEELSPIAMVEAVVRDAEESELIMFITWAVDSARRWASDRLPVQLSPFDTWEDSARRVWDRVESALVTMKDSTSEAPCKSIGPILAGCNIADTAADADTVPQGLRVTSEVPRLPVIDPKVAAAEFKSEAVVTEFTTLEADAKREVLKPRTFSLSAAEVIWLKEEARAETYEPRADGLEAKAASWLVTEAAVGAAVSWVILKAVVAVVLAPRESEITTVRRRGDPDGRRVVTTDSVPV
jgi:hypothetical protein